MNDDPQTLDRKCLMQLEEMDIKPSKILRNLPVPELLEIAIIVTFTGSGKSNLTAFYKI